MKVRKKPVLKPKLPQQLPLEKKFSQIDLGAKWSIQKNIKLDKLRKLIWCRILHKIATKKQLRLRSVSIAISKFSEGNNLMAVLISSGQCTRWGMKNFSTGLLITGSCTISRVGSLSPSRAFLGEQGSSQVFFMTYQMEKEDPQPLSLLYFCFHCMRISKE